MKTIVPMRRPNSSLHDFNDNSGSVREFQFPLVATVSVLSWIVLAIYFGVIVLGVFGVVYVTGIGIGSYKHARPPSLVTSCVPERELQPREVEEQFRKAA
ncbi:MAG TPA: hypothetical protein VLB87_12640 [Pyrinomonadaceae bacterium]|nr:hypothetical protein [Pyrinomonadaceae bacterium]